jgi:hypothetical protein
MRLFRSGASNLDIASLEFHDGQIVVKAADGSVHTFGVRTPPKATDLPSPPRSFPAAGLVERIGDLFDVEKGR